MYVFVLYTMTIKDVFQETSHRVVATYRELLDWQNELSDPASDYHQIGGTEAAIFGPLESEIVDPIDWDDPWSRPHWDPVAA